MNWDELKRLAEAATPGPWGYDGSYVCPTRVEGETTYVESWKSVADCHQPENTKFIAAANPSAFLALIAENERYRQYGCDTCDGSGHLHRLDGEYYGACTSCGAHELEQAKRQSDQLKAECEALRRDAELVINRSSKLAGEISRLRAKHRDWDDA